MRSDTLRVYKTVHTWTGIVAGLLLFIAFYAGAITMFKDSLSAWTTPPAVVATPSVPLDRADVLIARTLDAHPAARKLFTLSLVDGDRVRMSWQPSAGQRWDAWLDDQGQLHTAQSRPSDAARFIDLLHMTAGVPGGYDVGVGVMGVVSLLYGLALVAGVIVLLPTLVKDLFALRIGKNLKRMWLDAHNAVGILSLPFHLVMALSVVAFGLSDYIFDVQDRVIYAGALKPMMVAQNPYFAKAPATPRADSAPPPTMLPPARLLAKVRERAPQFEPTALRYRRAGQDGATVFVAGDDARYLARDGGFALMDPVSGKFLNAQFLPGDGEDEGSNWSASTSAFYALHFGSYGGAPVRWGYFVLGLAGAFLFYSGNLLWIESRRKALHRDGVPVTQRRSTYVMASLTVGVALGCICGISLTLVAGKLLAGRVGDLHAWHVGIYYATFVAAIVWAMVRGAARGSVELLALATLSSAAIPVTSLVGALLPASGLWFSTDPGALGVDVGAALGALCFAWMWRKTCRRIEAGRVDSVWSVRKGSDARIDDVDERVDEVVETQQGR
ncbi:PepSY-associated TM helix domain-containing protein [Paraburkholderia ginsengisoli]|uniref:PepSY domain-containing protein n=1 Tax=Paraburkholderia ginsengisoli TaxID=311231 RepID=A0A7T4TAJ8_9BURK|nr:PepSY-associated TM helix domain-containing protein [Paraburkholderia ginsengisoli]QQC66227.1 PepSY domain-containing protein [Paraburkholderia ginsengisoli]